MHDLSLPAGASARLLATARPGVGPHRWDVAVLDAADGAARLSYGSEIGAGDLAQRIEIPVQSMDCRLEIRGFHQTRDGWSLDRVECLTDTPDRLTLGFSDRALPGAQADDVTLNFTFGGSARRGRSA